MQDPMLFSDYLVSEDPRESAAPPGSCQMSSQPMDYFITPFCFLLYNYKLFKDLPYGVLGHFGNFGSFLGHFGQFWVIFGLFWVIFGPFFGANFFWPKMYLCYFLLLFASLCIA